MTSRPPTPPPPPTTRATLLLHDEAVLGHAPAEEQVESPWRFSTLRRRLAEGPLPEGVVLQAPRRAATPAELLAVHSPGHVGRLLQLRGQAGTLDGEALSPGSVDAALCAAGAAVELVDALLTGRAGNGFALVRPPGHHAERERARGFCLLGNVAVAAAAALRWGVMRLLIIDWDAHHGNGTQQAFWERPEVLFVDLHQDGLFPEGSGGEAECGAGAGQGATVNLPLPPGSGDAEACHVLERVLVPLAARFRPELILVSCGFDGHRDDPLSELRLTGAGYAALCRTVCGLAEQHAGGRLGLVLEGGYDPAALAAGVGACLEELARGPASAGTAPRPPGEPSLATAALAARTLVRLGVAHGA